MGRRGDVLAIDRDREARKHLWRGLGRLGARGRVEFVAAMCRHCRGPIEPRVTGHTGTTHEAYYDVMNLSICYGLNLYEACEALERRLRGINHGAGIVRRGALQRQL